MSVFKNDTDANELTKLASKNINDKDEDNNESIKTDYTDSCIKENGKCRLKADEDIVVKTDKVLKEITGAVSFYGREEHGGPTASGDKFNMYAMTCAHKSLPFGTKLKLTNTTNGKTVIVEVNDRGPYIKGRTVDLSQAAFKEIASVKKGVLKDSEVKIEVISLGNRKYKKRY